eukprot:4067538-Prymnesium_polylepis.2
MGYRAQRAERRMDGEGARIDRCRRKQAADTCGPYFSSNRSCSAAAPPGHVTHRVEDQVRHPILGSSFRAQPPACPKRRAKRRHIEAQPHDDAGLRCLAMLQMVRFMPTFSTPHKTSGGRCGKGGRTIVPVPSSS